MRIRELWGVYYDNTSNGQPLIIAYFDNEAEACKFAIEQQVPCSVRKARF